MGECRRDRPLREQCAERFALVEAERGDVDEPDDVRRVRAERGDDLAAVGVSDDDRGALLELEHLAQPRDVVGERAQRELRRSHLEALSLEALDHAAPAGSVGPGAVDENDVRSSVHFDSLLRSCGRVSVAGEAPARITRSCDLKARRTRWDMLASRSDVDEPRAGAPRARRGTRADSGRARTPLRRRRSGAHRRGRRRYGKEPPARRGFDDRPQPRHQGR